jgi:hypothetical protein
MDWMDLELEYENERGVKNAYPDFIMATMLATECLPGRRMTLSLAEGRSPTSLLTHQEDHFIHTTEEYIVYQPHDDHL